jgi:hypothetical protein
MEGLSRSSPPVELLAFTGRRDDQVDALPGAVTSLVLGDASMPLTLPPLDDVDPAESESRCNGIIHALFAMQNHVDATAIEAMAFCKRALASFTLNGGAQQVNNVIFFKHLAPLRRIIVVCHGAPPRYGPRN